MKSSAMENCRFVIELDKFVAVDENGINVLSARDQGWLAARDAFRDIGSDPLLGDRRITWMFEMFDE